MKRLTIIYLCGHALLAERKEKVLPQRTLLFDFVARIEATFPSLASVNSEGCQGIHRGLKDHGFC